MYKNKSLLVELTGFFMFLKSLLYDKKQTKYSQFSATDFTDFTDFFVAILNPTSHSLPTLVILKKQLPPKNKPQTILRYSIWKSKNNYLPLT